MGRIVMRMTAMLRAVVCVFCWVGRFGDAVVVWAVRERPWGDHSFGGVTRNVKLDPFYVWKTDVFNMLWVRGNRLILLMVSMKWRVYSWNWR